MRLEYGSDGLPFRGHRETMNPKAGIRKRTGAGRPTRPSCAIPTAAQPLTAIFFGLTASTFGIRTVSTPSFSSAVIRSAATVSATENARW